MRLTSETLKALNHVKIFAPLKSLHDLQLECKFDQKHTNFGPWNDPNQ